MGQEMGTSAPGDTRGKVGVVASSAGVLREVVCLLSRQGVAVVRAIRPGGEPGVQAADGFLGGLQALQNDPEIKVVVAIVAGTRDVDEEQVLEHVAQSHHPAVLCLLGGDTSRAWQAGAIPARRLDEAAHRAAAWVRGWDQALISAQLEEQDEELATMAAKLRRLLGAGRRGIVGLFASQELCREAWLMLGDVAGEGVTLDCVNLSPQSLSDALDDPGAGVILLDLVVEGDTPEVLSEEVAVALEMLQGPGPLVIAHVCGLDLDSVERAEARLSQAGVTIVGSNAAAARLAGMVVSV
ncbi:MAG TPA: hypothetical protein VLC95_02745 [Anaerolineae bacterium]|nr:hypothetical protein [Anaerolineae bacterium]